MFSQLVIEKLGYYVYGLKDPRNNKFFYIGKGIRNRAFSHIEEAFRGRGKKIDKISTIQSIISDGYELEPIIIRHGLDEDTAYEVESALIDCFGLENLANIQAGHKSSDRGIMSATDVQLKYNPKKLRVDHNTKILLVCINGSYKKDMSEEELYKITRGNWKCAMDRVKQCNYVFGVYHGLVKTVYIPERWYNIQDTKCMKRYFEGYVPENSKNFINKDVSKYIPKNQWSFKYIN
jgi:uncharacterized protein